MAVAAWSRCHVEPLDATHGHASAVSPIRAVLIQRLGGGCVARCRPYTRSGDQDGWATRWGCRGRWEGYHRDEA